MRAFLTKRPDGGIECACDTCAELSARLVPGEMAEVDWKSRNTRSLHWHKRYFALCNVIFSNVPGVKLGGDYIEFSSVDAVHLALKGLAGLYDALIRLPDGTSAMLIRSIAFDRMTADEWAAAWPRLLDVVHAHILPDVSDSMLEAEISRLAT